MKIYLVGGAVRDELLGLPVKEKDWVVVGASPEELLQQGFVPVGKAFPVFLHPDTKEEYALARIERKVSRGYAGFEFDASKSVTLKQDLERRDLTINAIAKTATGELIDPYGGIADIEQKILRHVSPAFLEDPVRVLRIARFLARFTQYGFQVAPKTLTLMQAMGENGELNFLVPERVWKEMNRALEEATPEAFFDVLMQSEALKHIMPELRFTQHSSRILKRAAQLSKDPVIRFATLIACVMESTTIKDFCIRLRVPSEYQSLAELTARLQVEITILSKRDPEKILTLFEQADAFRRPNRFEQCLVACEAIQSLPWDIRAAFKVVQQAPIQEITSKMQGVSGEMIKAAIREARLAVLTKE